MKSISRVLVANRGEIAVRIIRACRSLGIESVAAVSEADRQSLPARLADRAVCIGPSRAVDSYLNIPVLITAALGTKAEAIHPGYGFLAEQPELAEACRQNHLTFIGPSPENLRQMGNKLWARKIAAECGVPTIPGSAKVRDSEEAVRTAERIGFPVFIKAAAGGGGRGMKIASTAEDVRTAFDTLAAEVQSAFGDGTLYLERCIPDARHVEVQILGDPFGNVIHLGERDCSIQRRHQKMLEEAPCAALTEEVRKKMWAAALKIARSIRYENAGTIEFILDRVRGEFYFLEMNTRIQVEHPVTEQVTGVDLVGEQIRVAGGHPLGVAQEDVRVQGHAIECRINAESPDKGFMPVPGRIEEWIPPKISGIRLDSHCYPGYRVPPYYDSLLAKIIALGSDRQEAVERMSRALEQFTITGVETNIPFHKRLLKDPDFVKGKINTRWLEDVFLPLHWVNETGNT